MTNFSLVPDRSPEIILGTLRQKAPEFMSSEEYRSLQNLGGKLTESPGLVCAALTKFLCAKLERGDAAEKYFVIIEGWASAENWHVENLLITEVFENVRLPAVGEQAFKDRLGPASLELYERWLESPPEDRLSREK